MREVDTIAVAYLYAEGLRQVEIARRLELAESTVSRLLSDAERRYLKIEVKVIESRISPEERQAAKSRIARNYLEQRLVEFTRQPVEVRVFLSGDRSVSREAYENCLAEFSRRAAPLVRNLLEKTRTCGVSWGKTMGALIPAIERLPPPVSARDFQAFPICGEPVVDEQDLSSSSGLAARLQTYMKEHPARACSLYAVPAFIPEGFKPKEQEVIRKLIGGVNSYRRIFGDPLSGKAMNENCLAADAEMLLTSIGPADRPIGHGNVLRLSNVDADRVAKIVHCELTGVCIPKDGIGKRDEQFLEDLNARWTGIKRHHFERCAERARQSSVPGVVLVSIGANKAKYVLEAVRLGLVNLLLIDDSMQDELEVLMKKRWSVRSLLRGKTAR